MSEYQIRPSEFQEQIDTFKSSAEQIRAIKYTVEKDGLKLQSIDRFLECVEKYNQLIQDMATMMDQDAASMQAIKSKWLQLDSDIGAKTLGQLLFGDD